MPNFDKKEHERALINDFVDWFAGETGKRYSVLDYPDPPDARIKTADGNIIWVEATIIYRDQKEAIFLNTASGTYGTIEQPDDMLAEAAVSAIRGKLAKGSYRQCFETHGPGYLLLAEADPLFDEGTLVKIEEKVRCATFPDDRGFFKAIYAFCTHGGKKYFRKLPYST